MEKSLCLAPADNYNCLRRFLLTLKTHSKSKLPKSALAVIYMGDYTYTTYYSASLLP